MWGLAIFIDLSKAFDTVNHKILIEKLEKYGFRDKAILLLKSYLSNRSQYASILMIQNQTYETFFTGFPRAPFWAPFYFYCT